MIVAVAQFSSAVEAVMVAVARVLHAGMFIAAIYGVCVCVRRVYDVYCTKRLVEKHIYSLVAGVWRQWYTETCAVRVIVTVVYERVRESNTSGIINKQLLYEQQHRQ